MTKSKILNDQNRIYKISLIVAIVVTMISGVMAQSSEVVSPSDGSSYSMGDDLILGLEATNTDSVERTLYGSNIFIEDSNGNTVFESRSYSQSIASGDSYNDDITLKTDNLESLVAGQWNINVEAEWDNETFTTDSLSVNAEESKAVYTVSINNAPSSVTEGDSIIMDVQVENTGDADGLKDVVADAGGLGTSSRSISLNQGESGSYEFTFDTDVGDAGSYSVDISSEDDSDSQSVTVEQESTESDLTGSVDLNVLQPESSTYNLSNGLDLEWASVNNYNGERVIGISDIVVKGDAGRTYTDSFSRDESVAQESSTTYSLSLSASDLEDFDPGTWTFEVTDTWAQGDRVEEEVVDSSVQFTMEGDDQSNQEEETSNNDNTSDDGSDVIIDDGNDGDDSTDDNTIDDGSSDDSTDSNDGSSDGSEDDTDSSSTDCPDGFTYDSENDVCLEDDSGSSDESDNGDSSTDDSTNDGGDSGDNSDESSTDNQNNDDELAGGNDANTSMLQQEVAAGITIQTMLIGLIALLTLGLLFKRSSYTVKF
jgi:clumping factor A